MTRKRYVKLMMARGWSRNQVNQLAYLARKDDPDMTLAVKEAIDSCIVQLANEEAVDEGKVCV